MDGPCGTEVERAGGQRPGAHVGCVSATRPSYLHELHRLFAPEPVQRVIQRRLERRPQRRLGLRTLEQRHLAWHGRAHALGQREREVELGIVEAVDGEHAILPVAVADATVAVARAFGCDLAKSVTKRVSRTCVSRPSALRRTEASPCVMASPCRPSPRHVERMSACRARAAGSIHCVSTSVATSGSACQPRCRSWACCGNVSPTMKPASKKRSRRACIASLVLLLLLPVLGSTRDEVASCVDEPPSPCRRFACEREEEDALREPEPNDEREPPKSRTRKSAERLPSVGGGGIMGAL